MVRRIIFRPCQKKRQPLHLPPPFSFIPGPWRAAAEAKVASFALTYALDALRVGGDDVRLLYLHGAGWSVWRLDGANPGGVLIADGLAERPPYRQLADLLRTAPGSAAAAPLVERLKRELKFIKDTS